MTTPEGLFYFTHAIDEKLAKETLNFIKAQDWGGVSSSSNGRKVQQYGFEYDYESRKSTDYKKIKDIPEELKILQIIGLKVIKDKLGLDDPNLLNQCIVNKYEPGQGISAHIDKETFGQVIVCFSLGSATTITFSKFLNGQKITFDKYVEANSLYIMSGDSRYEWKHEIKPRVSDDGIRRGTRISVTFRTV